ncbi:hypothetical protein PF008_g18606 [Phytophthora fragariae]|uniref:Reverse transcriptase Ty1/copia-type domain-containing protein n=1 Tax=Phytophthora fragariae TaxID=53985 RepID=A0A6G0R650_9STRA|nr:hypothetical protein PF008_g18606 [Phytophthora fragariae]
MRWVYKTKMDAEGTIKRLKARLVACGNEQEFWVDYSVAFSAVIEMSSVKRIFVLVRTWRVPAKHGDVPNAYIKSDKVAVLDIFLCNGARIGQCPFQGKGMLSSVDHIGQCGPQELSVIHHDGYGVPGALQ